MACRQRHGPILSPVSAGVQVFWQIYIATGQAREHSHTWSGAAIKYISTFQQEQSPAEPMATALWEQISIHL